MRGRWCIQAIFALDPAARRHSPAEDVHALLMGVSFAAVGILLLKAAGLATGGVAGASLCLSCATGWSTSGLFVLINLPFFLFAGRGFGPAFTVKSVVAIIGLALLSALLPHWVGLRQVHPLFASLFGGTLIGMGMLALARHRASVGGVGKLALYLQQQRGVRAGLVQLVSDIAILCAALPIIGGEKLGFSIVSAVATNLILITYHRSGRYLGY